MVDMAQSLGEEMINGLAMVVEIEVVLVIEVEDLGLEGLRRRVVGVCFAWKSYGVVEER